MEEKLRAISAGATALGIEFGSTRIKAVLTDASGSPLASGGYSWENHFENGVWTYPLSEVWQGLAECYKSLKADVLNKYGVTLKKTAAIGISAMMHGYLPFDGSGRLLTPFRTWRNTMTGEAAEYLSELFDFNIPQRWSVAHAFQAILNGEAHVAEIDFLTTLAGYVHWRLTGERALSVGDASGMFPVDPATLDYNERYLALFDSETNKRGISWKLRDVLPRVMVAGERAGELTAEGAKLLDAAGDLEPGIPLCPPEGDAGTGMTATNSVSPRTGNVSAGTSVFAMIVLERAMQKRHPEIDVVATPTGKAVGMAHCNNCTTDLNAWVNLFGEFAEASGHKMNPDELYSLLYNKALEGDSDCGGIVSYNYYSGEHVTGMDAGRPLMARTPEAKFTLANFMRANLFSSLATLKIGMEILTGAEHVAVDRVLGHGGLFKTPGVGQRVLAWAIGAPVSVMETAGEGGAWGAALLAGYMAFSDENESLEEYLDSRVFAGLEVSTIATDIEGEAGFNDYMRRYNACLPVERAAVENLN